MTEVVTVEIEAAPHVSLAMVENSTPLVARLALTNITSATLEDLTVEIALLPDFSAKWTSHVSAIPAGGTFQFDEIALVLDRDKLVNQLERGGADLAVWVRNGEQQLLSKSQPISVLAYNEWSRAGSPLMMAAFVLPNHPAVAELLGVAKANLERLTGDPSLSGYQSHSPGRVLATTQAIYETLQARGITYSNPPASFERGGQKIRTPEQVLTEGVATCLDVSALLAAALEQIGLHPFIVLIKGHAFPGVWLDDQSSADGYIDDAATFRKLIDLDRVLVFDSSAAVKSPPVSFSEARRIAARSLETTPFEVALDINEARKQHYRPLPIRVAGGFSAVVEIPAAAPQTGPAGVPRPTSPDGSGRSRPSGRTKHPRVEGWKQRLLDTTLRSRLINFKDTKQSVDLMCAELGLVEDMLASGEELAIRSKPTLLDDSDSRSRKLLEARVGDDALKQILHEHLSRNELHSEHTADATTTKLTTIYRAAREALEETGTNLLCLALGMIHWYESDTSEEPRRAPILLVPVALTRNSRSGGFTIKATGEDTRLNVTMFEKLRIEKGIELPELAELPMDQAGVDVAAVMQTVRNAILNVRRWDVKEELHLGLFSFAKFQMWADLEQNIDALMQSPVINHLLNGNGEAYPNAGGFTEAHELDAKIAPKDLICPMDADASQLAAVVAAAEGKTFVLQGPPGTGKSQTITNLITHCIAQGKRVLFVAEKSAALDVVQRRLVQVGLGPYVLELHSHKSGKQQVLDQFREAADTQPVAEPSSWDLNTNKLADERAYLNSYATAMHVVRVGGISIFSALARLDKLRDAPLIDLPSSCLESPERFEALRTHGENLRHAAAALEPLARSPWLDCALPAWTIDLPSRVSTLIEVATQNLATAERAATDLTMALGTSPATTLSDVDALVRVATTVANSPVVGDGLSNPSDWGAAERDARELTALARRHVETMTSLREHYNEGLFKLDLDDLAARFHKFLHAFFLFAWWGLRGARKTLRTVAKGPLRTKHHAAADLDQARALQGIERKLQTQQARAVQLFGSAWHSENSEPGALDRAVDWATELHSSVSAVRSGLLGPRLQPGPNLGAVAEAARTSVADLRNAVGKLADLLGWKTQCDRWELIRERLSAWRGDIHRLRDWAAYRVASAALVTGGCATLVDAVTRQTITADQLLPAFERGALESWIRKRFVEEPVLATFNSEQHQRRVTGFAALDRANLDESKSVARARVAARTPVSTGAATGGEMGVLRKELGKKTRHMPIRKLLREIPSLAARLKPCFLMSPMSVATYLDPKTAHFDIIVFDEASQIPTHDAVGVLARGKSAVVVGDSKQLPPTSFFQSASADDESSGDNDFEELESILDDCIAAGLPERRLDWHYRSRHESLIAFSNFHYYRNKLNTFPSALEIGPGRGVTLRQVTGFYDKGASCTNTAEARAVVADMVARLRAPDAEKRTYGVVTFSKAQQKLVQDMLEKACADHPEIEPFFDTKRPEPVIVKNLENIQGDERDVMIFSICYGRDQNGKISMNFGPMNRDGGERRLNVAITRAREELVVFSTLQPEDIDLTRTNSIGVKHLKTFLDYARRGPIAIAQALTVSGTDQFDSPFEEQVCDRLRDKNLIVHTQVGCAGYRIDMGIRHPEREGTYVLGVECDGAYYHSARSARERDRLREQVLRGLGWQIHRIWSTDWWQMPDRELTKVLTAIETAKSRPAPAAHVDAPTPYVPPEPLAPVVDLNERSARSAVPRAITPTKETTPRLVAKAGSGPVGAPLYRVAAVALDQRKPDDVHDDRHRNELAKVLNSVVEIEAPISLRVLSRRILPYFGVHRTSSRLEDRLRSVLGRSVKIRDEIVWRLDQDPLRYNEVRFAVEEARREAQEVPLEEVANAALGVLKASVALERDELVKLTSRALGFNRTGEKVSEHMQSGVALLVKRGGTRVDGEKLVLA